MPMKNALLIMSSLLLVTSQLLLGCQQKEEAPQPVGQTCENERVLEVYQDRKAKIIKTELNRYCLTVDLVDIASSSYQLPNVLVPALDGDIPAQYRIEGLHVLLSGRKKSCYGLTSLPNLFNSFGYKLEVDAIKKLE